jgi:hypothetical protein
MDAGFGVTVTVAAVRGPLESPHAAMNNPANAIATIARAIRALRTSTCRVRLVMTLFIELLLRVTWPWMT